jgi:hypothetical protein
LNLNPDNPHVEIELDNLLLGKTLRMLRCQASRDIEILAGSDAKDRFEDIGIQLVKLCVADTLDLGQTRASLCLDHHSVTNTEPKIFGVKIIDFSSSSKLDSNNIHTAHALSLSEDHVD